MPNRVETASSILNVVRDARQKLGTLNEVFGEESPIAPNQREIKIIQQCTSEIAKLLETYQPDDLPRDFVIVGGPEFLKSRLPDRLQSYETTGELKEALSLQNGYVRFGKKAMLLGEAIAGAIVGGSTGRAAGRVSALVFGHAWSTEPGLATKSAFYSTNRKTILTMSTSGRVLSWNIKSGNMTDVLNPNPLHPSARYKNLDYSGRKFSQSGRLLAEANKLGEVSVWDVMKKKLIFTSGAGEGNRFFQFSPDEKLIAVGSKKCELRVYRLADKQLLLAGSADEPCIFSNERLLSGIDEIFSVWSLKTGERVLSSPSGVKWYSTRFSANEKYLVSHNEHDGIIVWEAATGKEIFSRSGIPGQAIFSPNGKLLAARQVDSLCVWDTATGSLHFPPLDGIAWSDPCFSSDGQFVMTRLANGSFVVLRTATGEVAVSSRKNSKFREVSFSPNRSVIAAISDADQLCLWNCKTGRLILASSPQTATRGYSFSPSGDFIKATSDRWEPSVWNTHSGNLIISTGSHIGGYGIHYSPDGKFAAAVSTHHQLFIWETRTGEFVLATESANYGRALQPDFSPSGRFAAICSDDGKLNIWETRSGDLVYESKAGMAQHDLTFSKDGKAIFATNESGKLSVWWWKRLSGLPLLHTVFAKVKKMKILPVSATKHKFNAEGTFSKPSSN